MPGRISSPYGNRTHPVTKLPGRFHNGVDVPAVTGTKVVAVADGKVIEIYETEKGGKTMIILHDNGFESRMCHLHKYLVKTGEVVKQGQSIAESGNTGASTGPHLHFGLRDSKKNYVNPADFITFQ